MLAHTRYERLNHTHLTELLMEREVVTLARFTVDPHAIVAEPRVHVTAESASAHGR